MKLARLFLASLIAPKPTAIQWCIKIGQGAAGFWFGWKLARTADKADAAHTRLNEIDKLNMVAIREEMSANSQNVATLRRLVQEKTAEKEQINILNDRIVALEQALCEHGKNHPPASYGQHRDERA